MTHGGSLCSAFYWPWQVLWLAMQVGQLWDTDCGNWAVFSSSERRSDFLLLF